MFKRLFWLAVGAGFGFGVSLWARKEVRELASRFTPERVAAAFSEAAREVVGELRSALGEGRGVARTPAGRPRRLERRSAGPASLEGARRVAG